MTAFQIAILLRNDFYHYYFPNGDGLKKSLMQIAETIEKIMTEEIRQFIEAQKPKPEQETVETFMRKSDKKLKPQPNKLKAAPTIKFSIDEKEESKAVLEKVKSQDKKVVRLPMGYSREWEKEKVAIDQRRQKKATI